MKRHLFFLIPVILFSTLVVAMLWGLKSDRDPGALPSALLDKPVPVFSLPKLYALSDEIDQQSLINGRIKLVNFFASWCIPCLAEHPQFMTLASEDEVDLIGIAWKNKTDEAKTWLERHGNPYNVVLNDLSGRVGIDWGVYGVPETYVVDGQGIVRFRYPGPITPEIFQNKIKPLIEKYQP